MIAEAPHPLDLAQGFAAFVEAARRLETSHAALKERAEAIDLQLADSNRALQRALAERNAILDALPVGVLAVNAEGANVWCNPEGARLREAAAAQSIDLVRSADGECERGALVLAVRRVALADGGELIVVEDRSQVRALSRRVDRLDRLAGLSELALGIAHEIKNPLNGVMGFAALLQASRDADEQRRYAERIAHGLRQVDGIVREMLAFAKAPDRDHATAPLQDIVAAAAAAAAVPRSCIDLFGAAELRGEATALVRVLANLFRNSAEAVAELPRIVVVAEQNDGRVHLTVRDAGPGVDPALGERALEPFTTTKVSGHGLGLALAARVVSFLGGSLELVRDGAPGAAFRIELPAAETVR